MLFIFHLVLRSFLWYIENMTITQTVEIPDSRWLNIKVPREVPLGRAQVELKIIPFIKKEEKPVADAYEAITNLWGVGKRMGSTLTVEQFYEMRREDLRLEEEKSNRLFPNKG